MEERKTNLFDRETIEKVLEKAGINVIESDFLAKRGGKPDPMAHMIMGLI